MKKLPLFLLLFIAPGFACMAQISWGLYSQTFADPGSPGSVEIIAAIPRENNAFWPIHSGSVLKNTFESDKNFMNGRSTNLVAVTTFDQQDAHFFVRGITIKNKVHFEYRVLQDGKETLADWSPISTPASDSVRTMSTIQDLFYIGAFKTGFGHYLVVDLRRKEGGTIISTAVVSWQPVRPQLFNIYTVNELNGFLQRLSHPNGFHMTPAERKKWQDEYGQDSLDLVT